MPINSGMLLVIDLSYIILRQLNNFYFSNVVLFYHRRIEMQSMNEIHDSNIDKRIIDELYFIRAVCERKNDVFPFLLVVERLNLF